MKSFKKRFFTLFTAVMLFFSFIPTFALPVSAEEQTIDIQILGTSDIHNKFQAWDYATDSSSTSGSLAQLATKINELREANPNTILVDNGDTLQGNSSMIFVEDEVHPMIKAMNYLEYDSLSVGNHEFNYGMDFIEDFKETADFPILIGNVYNDTTEKRIGEPYKIVEVEGIKVGIIGLVTPHITKWDGPNLKGHTVTNPVEEGKKIADELRPQVDIMIATFHASVDGEYGNGDSARELAEEVPELVAILAGHEHSVVGQVVEGTTVITEPGSNGSHISKIDIKVNKAADGEVTVESAESQVIAINGVKEDADVLALLEPYHESAVKYARTKIGELVGGPLIRENEVPGIPQGVLEDNALVDLINKVQLDAVDDKTTNSLRRVSGAALFDANANVQAGDITNAGTALIYKYDNTLMVLKVTGDQLKRYMEWSARFFNTFNAGDLTISFNENIRLYNYDMFSGVKYDINLSKAPGSRIENLTYDDGTEVKANDEIALFVNNYRANTTLLNSESGLFKGEKVEILYDSTNEAIAQVRDLIREYVTEKKEITPEKDNNWKLTGYKFDAAKRAKAIELVKAGKLKVPTSSDGRTPNIRSITWQDVLDALNRVDILTFNDFHGSLVDSGSNIGAAKLAGAIKDHIKDYPNTIVVAAGDIYQGSAMSNLLKGKPVSEMLKAMGVFTSSIGNHEFDWGKELIEGWAEEGGFGSFVAANIYYKATDKPVEWAEPYMIKEIDGKRIAFIGLTTTESAFKTNPELVKDLVFKDPVAEGNKWAKYVRENENVDAVIALTHLGADQNSSGVITGEAADLAKGAVGIDAIIAAHTHKTVNGKVNDIPVIQAYYNGRTLGKIHLNFNEKNELESVETSLDELYKRKAELADDAEVKAIVDKYSKELEPVLNEKVFDLGIDLPHDTTKNGGLSVMGVWSTALMAKAGGTQIAITNGGGLRRGFDKGEITMGLMYELLPFDNTIVTLKLKGSDLKRVIEHGILAADFRPGQFYGLKVYFDPAKEAGNRVNGMTLLDGTPIKMDEYYTVATNDFIYGAGDKYDFTGAIEVKDTGIPIRDKLVEMLKAMKATELTAFEKLAATPEAYMIEGQMPKDGKLPQTGKVVDFNFLVILGLSLAAAGSGLVVFKKKEKKTA